MPYCPCGGVLEQCVHHSANYSRVCWCDVCYHQMRDGESYYQCPKKHVHHWGRARTPYGFTWHVRGNEGKVSIEMCVPCSTRSQIEREKEHSLVISYRNYAGW